MLNIIEQYSNQFRAFHNFNHISSMLDNMKNFQLGLKDKQSLRLAILYHDYIYNPKSKTNEEDSVTVLLNRIIRNKIIYDKDLINRGELSAIVRELILSTKEHIPNLNLSKYIIDLDLWELADKEKYETNKLLIFKECLLFGFNEYEIIDGRKKWLSKMIKKDNLYYTEYCIVNGFNNNAKYNMIKELRSY